MLKKLPLGLHCRDLNNKELQTVYFSGFMTKKMFDLSRFDGEKFSVVK